MVTQILANSDWKTALGVSHAFNKINWTDLNKSIQRSKKVKTTIVLFEYVQSAVDRPILESERFPGTSISIHSVVQTHGFRNAMKQLLAHSIFMECYSRRKFDFTKPFGMEQITNTRQVVLTIDPLAFLPPPSPVFRCGTPSVSSFEYDDMPPLIPNILGELDTRFHPNEN